MRSNGRRHDEKNDGEHDDATSDDAVQHVDDVRQTNGHRQPSNLETFPLERAPYTEIAFCTDLIIDVLLTNICNLW